MQCPNCSHKMGSLANFCNKCGKKLSPVESTEKESSKTKWCNKLGHAQQAQNPRTQAFYCLHCGEHISL